MNFSMSFFKSRKQKELLNELKIEAQNIKNEILEQTLAEMTTPDKGNKPYRKMKFVNNVLTIILEDGSIVSKPQATADDFNRVRIAKTEAELMSLLYGRDVLEDMAKEEKVRVKEEHLYNGAKFLTTFPDFEMREEAVYMNGIDRSLPPLLVDRFAEIIGKYAHKGRCWENDLLEDVEYTSLKKFWLKCCGNANAQSAEDLYEFLTHHNFKIGRNGNFFAYRRVQSVGGDYESGLIDAISNAYNKVKAVWKKNPADFEMYINIEGEYKITDKYIAPTSGGYIGNLKELYLNLPNMKENRYTDAHTGTMDYRVGEIASIPRNECDDNNSVTCSRGLHIASKEYDYSGFGNTPILAIVNPVDVVAVPHTELGKMRCSRWFFAMTLEEDEKYILDEDDFDVTELDDIFEDKCLINLEQHIHKSFAEEVKRHTFTIPQMSDKMIKNIVHTLEDMKNAINNRVVRK
jgi:hypothetical protein